MLIPLSKTESIVFLIQEKIDHIFFRIKSIRKDYNRSNNKSLKIRLIKEHEKLKFHFIEIKSLVKLIDQRSFDNLSNSKLLSEKCKRCEKEMFKNNFLFST